MIGEKFDRLLVLEEVEPIQSPSGVRRRRYLCECACGVKKAIQRDHLRSGHTRSCGCLAIEELVDRSLKHGHSRRGKLTGTYVSWYAMISRCTNPQQDGYENYGGRGVKVCKRWLKFENFLADMGERPRGFTLERKENYGDYEPTNCKWATWIEQGNNKRNNVHVWLAGKYVTMAELCRVLNISYRKFQYYYRSRELSSDLAIVNGLQAGGAGRE